MLQLYIAIQTFIDTFVIAGSLLCLKMPCILDSDDANSIQVKKDSKVVLNSDENQKMSGETHKNGIEIKNGENGHEDSLEKEENLETLNGEVKTESEEAKTNAENPEGLFQFV